MQVKREFEGILDEKDRIMDRIKEDVRLRDKEIHILANRLKEVDTRQSESHFYEKEIEKY